MSMSRDLSSFHFFRSSSTLSRLVAACIWSAIAILSQISAQTEGDIGFDYHNTYDDEYETSDFGKDPAFDQPLANVTVMVGGTVLLPCKIEFLGKYKVAWLENNSIPLTYEDRTVIDDSRYSVVRLSVPEWNLQIRDVRLEDEGPYRCTVNTKPVHSKIIRLFVTAPARIVDDLSSGDKSAPEGSDVTFFCRVTGVPVPEVTWYRWFSPGRAKQWEAFECRYANASKGNPETEMKAQRKLLKGQNSLTIYNVSRFCDDLYSCHASNGLQNEAVRKMRLTVHFRPEITLPNRRIGQVRGRQTILECSITAFPQAVNYWRKDGKVISSSTKHRIEAYDDSEHTLTLSLRIIDLEAADYGAYDCVASNSLGRDEQSMQLYETFLSHHSSSFSSSSSSSSSRHRLVTSTRNSEESEEAGKLQGPSLPPAPQVIRVPIEGDIYTFVENQWNAKGLVLGLSKSGSPPTVLATCLAIILTPLTLTPTILGFFNPGRL